MKQTDGVADSTTAALMTPVDNTTTEAALDGIDGVKHKKKKKKDKSKDIEANEDSMEDSLLNNSVNAELTDVNGHAEKKKKKKKDKSQEMGGDDTVPLAEFPGSDSSGYLSDKGKRKRKESELSNINDTLENPVSKKKKNK